MHFLTKMACHLLFMTSYLVTIIIITKGHKISKRPPRSSHRSRTVEEETADRIGLQFNFA